MDQSIQIYKLLKPLAEESPSPDVEEMCAKYKKMMQSVAHVIQEKEEDVLEGCH